MPQRAFAAQLQNNGQGTQAGIKSLHRVKPPKDLPNAPQFIGYLLDAAAAATN